MLVENPSAGRNAYPEGLRQVMSIAKAAESRDWLSCWPELNHNPTPLWRLPSLARDLGVESISVKDESVRSPLASFKALGAPIALVRLILRKWPEASFTPKGLFLGQYADRLHNFTVISATDGNHGRALAAAAESIGCRCVIVLHRNVSEEREAAIAAFGAKIIRIAGNYDDSVQEAARLAEQNSWYVVSDTSYEGYEDIPRDVMQGYGTIAAEMLEQEAALAGLPPPYTHVFLQGGVGGLAAGIVSYFWEFYGEQRPVFIVVEPEQADCLYQSAIQGRPAAATGSVDSVMAGLACGETSPIAWKFLHPAVDFFQTVTDEDAVLAMGLLAKGAGNDAPIVSGESGAAGLAGLMQLMRSPMHSEKTGLGPGSRILLVNTEGATAPKVYEHLVGQPAEMVMAAQARWRTDAG